MSEVASAGVVTGSGGARIARWALAAFGAILIIAITAICVVVWLGGGRWFVVNSPSMGQVAPVGTLVVSAPVELKSLAVGDVIVFHPPTAPGEVYTHRVHSIAGATLNTQGDINGSVDPWIVQQRDLIGRAAMIIPGLGWAIKAIPFLAVGWALVWLLTWRFAKARWRAPLRITGVALVVSITSFILKPFVGVVLLATDLTTAPVQASLVSTGLLPIVVSASGGTQTSLLDGQVGTVLFPALQGGDQYQITSSLNLSFWGWVIAILICLSPLLWTLIVGLPADPPERGRRRANA